MTPDVNTPAPAAPVAPAAPDVDAIKIIDRLSTRIGKMAVEIEILSERLLIQEQVSQQRLQALQMMMPPTMAPAPTPTPTPAMEGPSA